MLGSQVRTDLELDNLYSTIPTCLPWGRAAFEKRLEEPISDMRQLKRTQLPLAALKAHPKLTNSIRGVLQDCSGAAATIDDALGSQDNLAAESIGQIFYGKDATACIFNTNNLYLNGVLFWKTLFLPGFAVLAPLIGILVPFFIFKIFGNQMSVPDYVMHVRGTILKQMSIPQFLKARHDGDRLGGFFEMLFVGFALVMFISSIWNQVNGALHLRSIWHILTGRGEAVNTLLNGAQTILDSLRSASESGSAAKRAYGDLINEGERCLAECADLREKSNIVCSGTLWNTPEMFDGLRNWFGRVDAYTAIATLPVCIVRYRRTTGLDIKGLRHPFLASCVSNNYCSVGHSVLTGPNRGGKSTFCKALGLALITAQTWGFAWADSVALCPFSAIHTALEPAGKLGYASTFEAEIAFAKSVLSVADAPLFVMMDEIFHSTNAVDGVRASGVFMSALYSKQDCVSLISTHYRDLAEDFSDRCSCYKMVAEETAEGVLDYTYKLALGVSSQSSVDELLRAHGLLETRCCVKLQSAVAPAEKTSQPNQNEPI